MSIQKISFDESLQKIVSDEKCMGCAACVVCCPLNSLEYVEEKPKLVGKCTECGKPFIKTKRMKGSCDLCIHHFNEYEQKEEMKRLHKIQYKKYKKKEESKK